MKFNIKASLMIGVAALAILLLGTVGTYQYSISRILADSSHLIHVDVGITESASRLKAALKAAHHNEKAFYLTRNPDIKEQQAELNSEMTAELQLLETLSKTPGYRAVTGNLSETSANKDAYFKAFGDVYQSWERRGFSHKSGLQGEFRTKVQNLEARLSGNDITPLYLSHEKMNSAQKDYLFVRTGSNKAAWLNAITQYEEQLEKAPLTEATRGEMTGLFERYQNRVKRALTGRVDVSALTALTQDGSRVLSSNLITDSQAMVLQIRRSEKDYLLRYLPKYIGKVHKKVAKLAAAVEKSKIPPQDKGIIAKQLAEYLSSFDALVAEDAKIAAAKEEMAAVAAIIEPEIDAILTRAAARQELKMEEATASANRLSLVALIVGLIAITLMLVLGVGFSQRLGQRIQTIAALMGTIADKDGDLRARLPAESNDELGELSGNFNRLMSKIQNTVQSVAASTNSIAKLTTGLSTSSLSMKEHAAVASSQAADVGTASNHIHETVEHISEGTQSVEESIQAISSNANRAAQVAQDASKMTEKASISVKKLSDNSSEIEGVLKVINGIAAQTHMLALNATIEAARAGDSGKGFAVVASEVQELARRTTEATELIDKHISEMITRAEDTVDTMQSITQIISEIDQSQEMIASAIQEQSSTTSGLSRDILDTVETISKVNAGIGLVASGSDSTRSEADSVERNIGLTTQAVAELQRELSQFKFDSNNITS